jgi:hypothetical protein
VSGAENLKAGARLTTSEVCNVAQTPPRGPHYCQAQFRTATGGRMAVTFQRNIGMLVLAIWLILYGLSGVIALGLPSPLMAVLALVSGILILVGR